MVHGPKRPSRLNTVLWQAIKKLNLALMILYQIKSRYGYYIYFWSDKAVCLPAITPAVQLLQVLDGHVSMFNFLLVAKKYLHALALASLLRLQAKTKERATLSLSIYYYVLITWKGGVYAWCGVVTVGTAKAGPTLQFLEGSSYPLSWVKHGSSRVVCILSASFVTGSIVR